jgi:hypothetical protein
MRSEIRRWIKVKHLQILLAPQQALARECIPHPSQDQRSERDTYILSMPRKCTDVSNLPIKQARTLDGECFELWQPDITELSRLG